MTAPLLTLRPDGVRPLTETFEFLTDLSVALDGSETRVPLRAFPRHAYAAQYTFLDRPEARAAREMLRYADVVGLPLIQHQLTPGVNIADAGAAASGPLLVQRRDGSTTFRVNGTDLGGEWSTAAYIAPYVEARIDSSRQITHRSAGVSSAVLTFQVDDLDEAIAPWAGPSVDGKPVWPVRADWSSEVQERIEDTADEADFGHLRLREVRYSKRSISVSLLLIGRPAILDFRRLMFALQGRCRAFCYAFEPDGIQKTWRLNSDTVSIDYLKTSLARCSLEFLELSE